MISKPASLSLLLLGSLLLGCAKKAPEVKRPPVPVTVGVAARASVPFTVAANGVVEPLQSAAVQAQVGGVVERVTFREGDEVRAGQLLFQIDPRTYEAALGQARGALQRDRAIAENARKDAERYAALVKDGVVTQQQADQAAATAASAAATVQADEAAEAAARLNLEYSSVRAPISGRTGQLLVKAGNLVRAGTAQPLVVINQINPVLVRFAVPGSALPRIQRFGVKGGLPVTVVPGAVASGAPAATGPTPAAATDAAAEPAARPLALLGGAPAAPLTGTLSFIDNTVDTTTGTVLLKATVPNPAGALWPGQFVSTSLRLFVEDSALVVPAQAVLTGQQGTYVYVIAPGDSARQQRVTVARTAGAMAVIASGLEAGERVVTDGQSRLTPGAKVQVRAPEAGGAPGRGGRDSAAGPGSDAGGGAGNPRGGRSRPAGGSRPR